MCAWNAPIFHPACVLEGCVMTRGHTHMEMWKSLFQQWAHLHSGILPPAFPSFFRSISLFVAVAVNLLFIAAQSGFRPHVLKSSKSGMWGRVAVRLSGCRCTCRTGREVSVYLKDWSPHRKKQQQCIQIMTSLFFHYNGKQSSSPHHHLIGIGFLWWGKGLVIHCLI